MEQEGLGDEARLIFITHTAREADVQATLHDLRDLDVVDRVGTLLRVDLVTQVHQYTRRAPELDFDDAVLEGLARDGGLYVPETLPEAGRASCRRPTSTSRR